MISVAVCDDEKSTCAYLEKRTLEYCSKADIEAVTDIFYDGTALCTACKAEPQKYDIILLDIKMTNSNGVESAKLLREYGVNSLIVFVTSSAEYVFSGYEVKAFRYILKTELVNAFDKIFGDCIRELKKDETSIYTVKKGSELTTLRLDDIYYFESDKRLLIIRTRHGEVSQYEKLDAAEKILREKDFVRIHQSFLVNAKKIKSLGTGEVTLENGDTLPVSKSRKKSVSEAYLWARR